MSRKLLFLWGFLLILAGSTSGALFTGEYFDDSIALQYNRARWYAPAVGRFVSMDRIAGHPNAPASLNKYLYANSNAINFTDPSGFMGLTAELGSLNIRGILSSISLPSFSYATRRIGVTLLVALGAYALTQVAPIFKGDTLKTARKALQENIERRNKNKAVIYHYTSFQSANEIVAAQCIYASKGYRHGDGIYRPPGAYATAIPPWHPEGTIEDLRAVLYDKPRDQDISAFVAIIKDPDWQALTGVENVKRGYPGTCVPVEAISSGANLWPGAN